MKSNFTEHIIDKKTWPALRSLIKLIIESANVIMETAGNHILFMM